jgi:very-short-patch-repair endonuclease
MLTGNDIGDFTATSRARRAWLLHNADARAESPAETVTRYELRAAGHRVTPQRVFPGIGRVDLVVDDAVVVETDGRDYHSDPAAFSRDRRRDRQLAAMGFVVLRYPSGEAIRSRGNVLRDVEAVLKRRAA